LEASGQTKEAVEHFEKSGTHRVEVPRMLFDAQQIEELNVYVDHGSDQEVRGTSRRPRVLRLCSRANSGPCLDPSQLLKWWAQYAESNARFREALQYYERAGDHLAIVRVLCFHKKFERAAEVVANTNNLGAAYHLAKQYEAKDVRAHHHQMEQPALRVGLKRPTA
jgi:hypothetical protein